MNSASGVRRTHRIIHRKSKSPYRVNESVCLHSVAPAQKMIFYHLQSGQEMMTKDGSERVANVSIRAGLLNANEALQHEDILESQHKSLTPLLYFQWQPAQPSQ